MNRRIEAPDEGFMRLALEKAREGGGNGQAPFAACIVRAGGVISCEHNAVWSETDSTLHAEVHAIRVAERKLGTIDLSGCTIYSTTEPCPMCFSAIHWARIGRIVFGNFIADAQQLGFSELTIPNLMMKQLGGSPVQITPGVLREESDRLFRDWIASNRGRTY